MWKSRGFFLKQIGSSLSQKKVRIFLWWPIKISLFLSLKVSQYLKRQSFSDFSQIFIVSRNKAKFSISEKKTGIEHQITKLFSHWPEREIELWYKKGAKKHLEKVTITLLFDVRFQFSFQVSKIQPHFLILEKFERNRRNFVASKIDTKTRIKKREFW